MRPFSTRSKRRFPDSPKTLKRHAPSQRTMVGAANHEAWLHLGRILTARDAAANIGQLTSFMMSAPLGLCFHLRHSDRNVAGLVIVTVETLGQRGPTAAVEAVAFLNQVGALAALPPCRASNPTPVLAVW